MAMTLNRLSGLVAAGAGALMIFWMIPAQTEPADFGWLKPDTLPRITALILIGAGLVHFIFPKGTAELAPGAAARTALFLGVSVLAVAFMGAAGFIFAAPVLMLALMLMVGERRWYWLVTGVVLLPSAIWFCVDFLLNRPLP